MNASNRLTLCAIALSAGLLLAGTANAGNSGGSHAVSAPQQKSVRQSADIKLPNSPPASRKLQKRDATAVKMPANKNVKQDFSRAAAAAQKLKDDLEKKRKEKAKEANDLINEEAKKEGLEHGNTDAEQQAQKKRDDQNPLSDPIGYIEKQLQDGTTSHGSQPIRSDNFVQDANDFAKAASDAARTDNFTQDANDFAKGASQYGEPTKGGSGHGFGGTAKDVMDKATKDSTPARLRNCANC
jgi:hypothetical protein